MSLSARDAGLARDLRSCRCDVGGSL